MKKVYEKPMMSVENFLPNEFCSSCGQSGQNVYFKCNAPAGPLYYFTDYDNKLDGKNSNGSRAKMVGFSYNPCYNDNNPDGFHEVNLATDPGDSMFDGFVDKLRFEHGSIIPTYNGKCDPGEEVIVWLGKNKDNGHATKELDVKQWVTPQS